MIRIHYKRNIHYLGGLPFGGKPLWTTNIGGMGQNIETTYLTKNILPFVAIVSK